MQIDLQGILPFLQFLLQFAVIPLILILWRLNNSLSELKLLMYMEFVTKSEMEKRLEHKENSHNDP